MRRETRPDPDDRRARRIGSVSQGNRRREGHRDFVRDARAVRVHVDRAVRLAVGAQAPVGAEIHEADGRRLAVAVEEQGRVARRIEIPAAEHARSHLVRVEVHAGEHRGEAGKRERCGAQSQTRPSGNAPQENEAQARVERGSGRGQAFQAEEGHADVRCGEYAEDGTQRIGRIHRADRLFPVAAVEQRIGDERQRDPRAERCREHDGERDAVAREQEQRVSGFRLRERVHHGLHQPEHLAIERQRREREQAHRHQHDTEKPDRVGDRVDAPAHPVAPARDAQDEGREHQLERVRRGSEDEREHADPGDFEDERSGAGEERDREEESKRRRGFGIPPRAGASPHGLFGAAGEQPYDGGEGEIQDPGALHGAREPKPFNHDKSACQHADRGPEAVGEIKHRERFSGRRGIAPDETRAHEGKGHAEQHRLRQDQKPRERPLEKRRRDLAAERGQNARVGDVGRCHENRVERERREPDQAFRERVAAKEVSPGSRPPAAEPRPDRHSPHEKRQHQSLRIGRVAEEEFQIVAPDRLVDEPGKPGYGEQQEEYAAGDAAHVWIVGRMLAGAGIIRAGCRGA